MTLHRWGARWYVARIRSGLCNIMHLNLHTSLSMQDPFPVLLPSLSATKEKEAGEFRSLLQTVFSCLKSVLYCMVAFHTNRGLQAPVGFHVLICSLFLSAAMLPGFLSCHPR